MRFRGQYVVARSPKRIPTGFVSRSLGEYQLVYHEQLPVAVTRNAALIGYSLDWRRPEASQDDVLNYLVQDPVPRSSHLAGRWAFVSPGKLALNDACATMGVYWSTDAISSSAMLLDYVTGPLTRIDRQAFQERQDGCHSGSPIPGRATEFEECSALLANHFLDWEAGRAVRFHPITPYASLPAVQVAPRIAAMLTSIIAAAASRKPIATGATAGFDSRALIQAVSNAGLAPETIFYTFEDKFACPKGHFDIEVGRRVVLAAGGNHTIIRVDGDDTSEPSDDMPAPRFESWAAACANSSLRERLLLSGWCSETVRGFMRWEGSEHASAAQIIGCSDATDFAEFHQDLTAWYTEAVAFRDRLGVPILDLFYWEQRGTGWIGSGLNILNSGCDWLAVYSCRDLLDLMLSVRENERGGSGQKLYRLLAGNLVSIPFNPRSQAEIISRFIRNDLKNLAIRATRRAGLYEILKRSRSRR